MTFVRCTTDRPETDLSGSLSIKFHHDTAHSRLVRITPVSFDKADVALTFTVCICVDSLETTMDTRIEEFQSAATLISCLSNAGIANVIRISRKVCEFNGANWTGVFGLSQLILLDDEYFNNVTCKVGKIASLAMPCMLGGGSKVPRNELLYFTGTSVPAFQNLFRHLHCSEPPDGNLRIAPPNPQVAFSQGQLPKLAGSDDELQKFLPPCFEDKEEPLSYRRARNCRNLISIFRRSPIDQLRIGLQIDLNVVALGISLKYPAHS